MHTPSPSTTATITPDLCEAARHIGDHDYVRGRKTWRTRAAPDLAKEVVTKLVLANFAKVRHQQRRDHVELTDLGREIAAMADTAAVPASGRLA